MLTVSSFLTWVDCLIHPPFTHISRKRCACCMWHHTNIPCSFIVCSIIVRCDVFCSRWVSGCICSTSDPCTEIVDCCDGCDSGRNIDSKRLHFAGLDVGDIGCDQCQRPGNRVFHHAQAIRCRSCWRCRNSRNVIDIEFCIIQISNRDRCHVIPLDVKKAPRRAPG
jgi:hypothetical protein